jgi:hypothetical protein
MARISEKEALTAFENAVQYAKSKYTNWNRLANLYVLFMDKFRNSKTTKIFLSWLQDEANEWDINNLQTWNSFYIVGDIKKFIWFWVAKEDIDTFMNFIKENDEKLWKLINES